MPLTAELRVGGPDGVLLPEPATDVPRETLLSPACRARPAPAPTVAVPIEPPALSETLPPVAVALPPLPPATLVWPPALTETP